MHFCKTFQKEDIDFVINKILAKILAGMTIQRLTVGKIKKLLNIKIISEDHRNCTGQRPAEDCLQGADKTTYKTTYDNMCRIQQNNLRHCA